MPGLCLGALPFWVSRFQPAYFSFGWARWPAVPFWIVGWLVMAWCSLAFAVRGQGTPSPTDPPKNLVVTGLYRRVRNPIYLGALAVLLGWVLWHPSLSILLMPPIVVISAGLFVRFYEEPHLRRLFGASYEAYCRAVPRWIPRFR